MNSVRRAWLVFAACALAVAVALGWISAVALRLERSEIAARAEAENQERLRAALWRMDSWLSMFLAREAARPYTEYLPDSPEQAGRAPSRLVTWRSTYLPLHFQVDANGVTSPQLPPPPPLAAGSDSSVVPWTEIAVQRAVLDDLRPYLDLNRIVNRVAAAESLATTKIANTMDLSRATQVEPRNDFEARAACTVPDAPGSAYADGVAVDVGPLVPLWLSHPGADGDDELVFLRRVNVGSGKLYQGFVADWSALRTRLLAEARDLFPQAELVRVPPDAGNVEPGRRDLANIPVALVATAASTPPSPGWSATRTILGLAWLLAFVAVLAVGLTLHKSVQLGERRRRFVSAVTHELRTPLTTFRMYSEMLARGFVRDEEQRRQYLETLKDESERLSGMVENVLAHARLEGRRGVHRAEPLTLEELLDRVTPPLRRHAETAGMELRVECASNAAEVVKVDAESIGQVLRNLVDNAAKYGRNGHSSEVSLQATTDETTLTLKVRDHGPGISETLARAVFKPFDRGGRDSTDPQPGIGLGLSIARGLARDMRGDVTLEHPADGGACFRLDVPAG